MYLVSDSPPRNLISFFTLASRLDAPELVSGEEECSGGAGLHKLRSGHGLHPLLGESERPEKPDGRGGSTDGPPNSKG